MENEYLDELIVDLERDNAIRLLPELSRKILIFVEEVEEDFARRSNNLGEYFELHELETPVSLATKQFDLSIQDIESILIAAHQKVNNIIQSKHL